MFDKDYFVINSDDKQKFDTYFNEYKTWFASFYTEENHGINLSLIEYINDEKFSRIDDLINKYSYLDSIQKSEHTTETLEYMIQHLQEFFNPLSQNQAIYEFNKALKTHDHYDEKVKEKSIKSFEDNGLNLPEEDKELLNELTQRLTKLKMDFSKNIIDSKKEWNYVLTDDVKSTLSEKELSLFKEVNGQLILLFNVNEFSDIMSLSESQSFRKIIYDAYGFIASPKSSHDNTKILHDIMDIRNQQIKILGKTTYAEHTLKNCMAKDYETVNSFLVNLQTKMVPLAKKDLNALYAFVKEHYNKDSIEKWDIGYYSNKKKEYLLNYKYKEERQYFPEKQVFEGSFKLIEKLFGFTFKKDTTTFNLPYADTVCYQVFENKVLKSYVIIDLYERETKKSGAWVSSIIPATRNSVGLIALNCNFNKKDIGLGIEEITTFLHEFGHAVHNFSSSTKYQSISGTSGMSRDAVEIPSQMLEQFAYNKEFLKGISAHYKTGEKIPDALIDTLVKTKTYGVASFYTRQLAFSLFDIRLHNGYTGNVHDLYKDIALQTLPLPVDDDTNFPNTFSHIFSGGYSAGYYGYLWSDIYSVDAYLHIIEDMDNNALKFKQEFLTHGSSKSPEELYHSFRKEDVNIARFLTYYGIE